MRAIPFALAFAVCPILNQASAQPKMQNMDPAIQTTNAGYDDLGCAARYTLAAFVIRNLDTNAAEYYASRAAAAGERYMEMHPGESEHSYASRVAAGAQDIQQRLTAKAMTPEALVDQIKRCDKDADSLTVL